MFDRRVSGAILVPETYSSLSYYEIISGERKNYTLCVTLNMCTQIRSCLRINYVTHHICLAFAHARLFGKERKTEKVLLSQTGRRVEECGRRRVHLRAVN